jgi:hypothetical protein
LTKTSKEQRQTGGTADFETELPRSQLGLKLFRRLITYHAILAVGVVLIALLFPDFLEQLPIGGIRGLEASGDVTVTQAEDIPIAAESLDMVDSLKRVTNQLDRLGYARQLVMVLVGVWLLMLPVSWVHKGIHHSSAYDHSLDETTLILPGIVAAIVLVVQHSLALAFSLAGIIAGVQFRRALQDTFDALFILVAIGTGIAAGVEALDIAAVLTIFFSYATLYVYYYGDGFESDYLAKRKLLKRQRKEAAPAQTTDQEQTD